ncbi:hypothetical protein LZG74_20020 [Dyadobacter sp. CY327]|uniref:hypothetical protein n=1 Tax=Dyadobacter sp. CY327 TaxID=2907301 RepID=UPI001F19B3D8|nr:hypothetical protein [Dyadobacter sp. CY327]MCE7072611.1 hypothetical protein [Dyadobacter sp. CY327]
MEDLCDSIREREESLAGFIAEVIALEKAGDQASEIEKAIDAGQRLIRIRRYPVFIEGIADQFFKIFKEYFEERDQ